MVAVVVRPMDRAIMIRRKEGIYMVLDSLAKDNHSSSRAAHTTYHGGLSDFCKAATLGYECGTFVTIYWRIHSGFGRHMKASGDIKAAVTIEHLQSLIFFMLTSCNHTYLVFQQHF